MGDRKVPNTASKAEAEMVMFDAMLGGNSGDAIERQEARGQQDLVNSTQLPVEGSENEAFTKMGIVFGIAVEGELFRHADLPPGWKKEATDHSMWSNLLDANGNKRAAIFYKAAFYDRHAHMHPCRRFEVRTDFDHENAHPNELRVCVFDTWGGKDTVRFDVKDGTEDRQERWKKSTALEDQCKAWLAQNYPDWKDESAYWDSE